MNPADEVITRCLEEIDANFVKAIDIVTSMNKTIKNISTNMKELDACSQVEFDGYFEYRTGLPFSICVEDLRARDLALYLIFISKYHIARVYRYIGSDGRRERDRYQNSLFCAQRREFRFILEVHVSPSHYTHI